MQHFQGYPETPKPFFIERQGETYKVTYTCTFQDSYDGIRFFTHHQTRFIAFVGSYDAAVAVVDGFLGFIEWLGKLNIA